jgi:AraC-like DNA-binding protein
VLKPGDFSLYSSNCLVELAQSAGRADPSAQVHLASSVIDLLCSGVAAISSQAPGDLSRGALLTTLRIESFIASNLRNPDLSRTDVACAMGMSVRRINELLAKKGSSINRRIQEVRLERIRLELCDPAHRHVRIGEIALKWGFSNLQHFSRVFASKYGRSPRGWRAAHAPPRGGALNAPPAFLGDRDQPEATIRAIAGLCASGSWDSL